MPWNACPKAPQILQDLAKSLLSGFIHHHQKNHVPFYTWCIGFLILVPKRTPYPSQHVWLGCFTSTLASWLWPNLLSWNVERLELENDGIFQKEKSSIFSTTWDVSNPVNNGIFTANLNWCSPDSWTSCSASVKFQGLYLPWTPVSRNRSW